MNFQNKNSEIERCGEIFITVGRNIVFLCTVCGEKFDEFGEYVAHLDEHYPEPLPDSIELIQFKQEEQLCSMATQPHNVLDEDEIPIPKSEIIDHSDDDESFSNREIKEEVNEEIMEEAPQLPKKGLKYKCTICTATCKDSKSLTTHIKRHATEKTHYCPKCAQPFYTLVDLKKHLKLHYKEPRFLCTICGKICRTNSKLVDHTRRHTNQKDFKCPHCVKSFYNRRLLSQHILVHSDERSHKCDLCNSSFTFKKGLMNHKKLHENKRNYKCNLCSATFNQQAGLSSHIKCKHKP